MALTEDKTGGLQKLTWTWTSTSAGAHVATASTYRYNGAVVELITIPAAGGDAPTALHDVEVLDGDNVDVLSGLGADRSATAREYKGSADGLGFVKSSKLTLSITNAGDIKQGTTILYILDLDKGVVG